MPEVQAGPCRPSVQAEDGIAFRFRNGHRGLSHVQRDFTSLESIEGPNDHLPQLQRLRPNLIQYKGTKK